MPPPEVQPADRSAQAPKGFVVLAIGLPGSGKTTWFRRRGVTPLSSDLLRNILFDDVEEQRYQGLVFSTLRSLLRARLIARMPWNYVDATNLSIHERRQWIKMAKSFGYEVQAVFFDVPLEVCLDRNRQRDRSVSEDVMRKMAEKLKPPAFRGRLRQDHRRPGEKRQLARTHRLGAPFQRSAAADRQGGRPRTQSARSPQPSSAAKSHS